MKKVTVLMLLALLTLLAGCQSPPSATGIYNNVYGGHTLKSVEKSILEALYDLEWSARKINHQTIEATLYVEKSLLSKHSEQILTVMIAYSDREYSIRYKSSVNLDYDIETNTIDSRYDIWVDELQQRIQDRLAYSQQQILPPTVVYEAEAPLERVVVLDNADVSPPSAPEPVPVRATTTERVIVVEMPSDQVDTTPNATLQNN